MNKKLIFISVLIISLGILVFIKWSKSQIKQPEFKNFKSIQLVSIDNEKAVLKAELEFYNPNKIDALILNSFFKINSKGNEIGNAFSTQIVELKSMSDVVLPLNFSVDLNKVRSSQSISDLLNTALDKQASIQLNFKGEVKINVKSINYTIPINHNESIRF